MAKKQPVGTVSHTIFLPEELHKQVSVVAGYGHADELIVECLTEAMKLRWVRWVRQENEKLKRSER